MSWWPGAYLIAGVVAWLAVGIWIVMREERGREEWWEAAFEGMCALLVAWEFTLFLVPIFLFFWPVCVPFAIHKVRAFEPGELLPKAAPQRSAELDARRERRRELAGMEGVAATDLLPGGLVEVAGERFDAVLVHGSARVGERVRITGGDDLRLEVECCADQG